MDYIRYIDNVTILADVKESVELPNPLVAHMEDGSTRDVYVNWENKPVDTGEEIELIFVGRVDGYALDVLCSIQVGHQTDNPASSFPECIDQFGLPKRDIQTADIPHIDDYQYFKAKIPRTLAEEYHLKQLRELVADQIILARDINHIRNAIVEMQKYMWVLQDLTDALEDRMDAIEDRVDWVEDNMVIDGRNLGAGSQVFDLKRDRVLEFRSLLAGEGIELRQEEDSIVFDVEEQGDQGSGVCGVNTKSKSFEICHNNNLTYPLKMEDGMLKFTDYFNFQMVDVENRGWTEGTNSARYYTSLLWVLGSGTKDPIDSNGNPTASHGTDSSLYAGRLLKANTDLIFEIKTGKSTYAGFKVGEQGVGTYESDQSMIQREIYNGRMVTDIYSTDVHADRRATRWGYGHADDGDM